MSDESKAFNEVRQLLGKLDRSIDEARTRRLGPPVGSNPKPSRTERESSVDLDQEIGGTTQPGPKTELQRKTATFGRAKPLNRDGSPSWKGNDDQTIG